MALIANEKFLTIAYGQTILVYDLISRKSSEINLIKNESIPPENKSAENTEATKISAIACSKCHKYLSLTDDNKQLYIFHTENWSLINRRTIPKRCTSMVFSEDGSVVLVADKSGDVNSFSVQDSSNGHSLVVGHVSMLIDLVLCRNDRFLITGDRDEKIRVSHFPNSYNIAMFCLGHLDFISQLVYAEDAELLISGSGDGTVKVWNYLSGQELDSFDCLPHVESADNLKCPNLVPNQSDDDNSCRGVDVRNISYLCGSRVTAVSFERRSEVLVLELKNGKMELVDALKIEGRVLDVKLSNNLLFVLHLTRDEKNMCMSCYKIIKDEFLRVQTLIDGSSDAFFMLEGLRTLNDKLLTFGSEISTVTDWSKFNCSLHKMHIDNISEYIDRKRQRMEDLNKKKTKKQKMEVEV